MSISDAQLKDIFGKATWVPVIPLKNEMATMLRPATWNDYHQRQEASAPADRTTWAWYVSDPDKNLHVPLADQNAVMGALMRAGFDPLVVTQSAMAGGNDAGFVMISSMDIDGFNRLKARYDALEHKM